MSTTPPQHRYETFPDAMVSLARSLQHNGALLLSGPAMRRQPLSSLRMMMLYLPHGSSRTTARQLLDMSFREACH
jgi:hypothetical protein